MNIEKFIKEDLEIKVRVNDDGWLELNLEDVARGLGFEREKNDRMYIMWDRVDKYLKEFAFHTCVEKQKTSTQVSPYERDGFVPEWLFYMLCMKAKNEKAKAFQLWISKEVLPSLRKNNFYYDKENINEEQIKELQYQVAQLSEKITNFSNALLYSPRKQQRCHTFLRAMFPDVEDVYEQFLGILKEMKLVNEENLPTENSGTRNINLTSCLGLRLGMFRKLGIHLVIWGYCG